MESTTQDRLADPITRIEPPPVTSMKPTLRVLVVDGEEEERATVMRYLARDEVHHHVIEQVASGEAALEACRHASFDVLLLDQNMPGMDGLAVLKAVRALPQWRGAVVACTSTGEPEVARRFFEAGVTDLLHKKDLSPSLLSRALENALIRSRLENQLKEAQRRTAQLQVLAEGLSRVASAQQMIPLIVEQSVRALGAAAGYLALATDDGRHFKFEAGLHLNSIDDRSGREFRIDAPLPAAECLRTGALFTFSTVAERELQFPSLTPLLREFPGLAVVPLPGVRQMIGAMGLLFADEHSFPPEEREHLKLVGAVCGQALERAALYDEARTAREAASLSVDRYRALVSATAQIIWRSAPTGELTTITGNWAELTGLEATAASGFGWAAALHPDDRAAYLAESAHSFALGRPFTVEVRIRARDGRYRWFVLQAAPVHDQAGQIREWIGASTDFTERKAADEALRNEREQFRLSTQHFELALKSSQVVVFNQDRELRYTWIHNPALGLRAEEMIGKRDIDLFDRKGDAAATEHLKREVLRTGTGLREEVVVEIQGQTCHYDLVIEPLYGVARRIVGVTCVAVDISERKRLEERLVDNEQQLRLALVASNTGIWSWDPSTNRVEWSPECFKIYGLEPGAFEGTGQHFFRLVHADDRERVGATVRAALDASILYQCEFRVLRPEGTTVWVENIGRLERIAPGAPLRMLGTITDVTARRQASEGLRRSEERLARAQRAARVGTWDWNVVTDEVYWTQEAWLLFGHEPFQGDVTYERWLSSVHPDDRARADEDKQRGRETGHYRSDFRVLCPDGSVRWLESEGTAEFEHGSAARMVGTVRDVTLQRAAQAQVLSALKRTEDAVLARDQLVALVSHDLKNPLTAMSIGVDFLRRQLEGEQPLPPREKIVSTLHRLGRQTRRMDRLLDELLDVARLHAGKSLELERRPMDLSALVRTLVEEHEQTSPDHHFELNIAAAPVLGTWDRKRIERVLNNLVSNAVKYSPGGGVVRVELEPAAGPGEDVIVRVTDAGVGIGPSDLSRIFDWYTRGQSALHQTIHGVGIGLAGARLIVDEHGGAISVESTVSRGSTFTVRLPTGLPAS